MILLSLARFKCEFECFYSCHYVIGSISTATRLGPGTYQAVNLIKKADTQRAGSGKERKLNACAPHQRHVMRNREFKEDAAPVTNFNCGGEKSGRISTHSANIRLKVG